MCAHMKRDVIKYKWWGKKQRTVFICVHRNFSITNVFLKWIFDYLRYPKGWTQTT